MIARSRHGTDGTVSGSCVIISTRPPTKRRNEGNRRAAHGPLIYRLVPLLFLLAFTLPPLSMIAQVHEYPMDCFNPYSMANGPTSSLWFMPDGVIPGLQYGIATGVFTPDGLVVNCYFNAEPTAPFAVGELNQITQGPDGAMYFTLPLGSITLPGGPGAIGRVTADGQAYAQINFPTSVSQEPDPRGITTGADGKLWITDQANNSLWRLSVPANTFTQYPLPQSISYPNHIITGPDHAVWFLALSDPGHAVIVRQSTDAPGQPPLIIDAPNAEGTSQLAVGSDNGIWVPGVNYVCRVGIATYQLTSYPVTQRLWEGIAEGPDNNLWITSNTPPGILRMTPTGNQIAFYPTQDVPFSILKAADNNLWFTESYRPLYGMISVSCVPPTATALANFTSICPGSSSTLTGSGGTSCHWTSAPADAQLQPASCTQIVRPTQTTTYSLTVSNSCGTSSNSAAVTITVAAQPAGPPITGPPPPVTAGETGLQAQVPSHPGSLYHWEISSNGTITSEDGLPAITFTANAPGDLILTVTETHGGCTSSPSTAHVTVEAACTSPARPNDPQIHAAGNHAAPVTGIDYLDLSWTAPSPAPLFYRWALNGGAYESTSDTGVSNVPPTGSNSPITLVVKGACSSQVVSDSAEVTISPTEPTADFTTPAASVGVPVTLTDTSDPQATSWLWLFGDGGLAQTQSATHTYSSAGTYTVWLIASNGAGSDSKSHQISVNEAGSAVSSADVRNQRFDASRPGRQVLHGVIVGRNGRTSLSVHSLEETEDATIFMRILGIHGELVAERRLVVAPGQDALYDVGAYGVRGVYTLELVSTRRFEAALSESSHEARESERSEGR